MPPHHLANFEIFLLFKDLNRRTAADTVLGDKAFNVAKNLKYDGCQRGLVSLDYNFF